MSSKDPLAHTSPTKQTNRLATHCIWIYKSIVRSVQHVHRVSRKTTSGLGRPTDHRARGDGMNLLVVQQCTELDKGCMEVVPSSGWQSLGHDGANHVVAAIRDGMAAAIQMRRDGGSNNRGGM